MVLFYGKLWLYHQTAVVEVQIQQTMQRLWDLEWFQFWETMPIVASVSWLTEWVPVCFSAAVAHLLHFLTFWLDRTAGPALQMQVSEWANKFQDWSRLLFRHCSCPFKISCANSYSTVGRVSLRISYFILFLADKGVFLLLIRGWNDSLWSRFNFFHDS